MTEFVLNMTGFVFIVTRFALSMTGFDQIITGFVLNMIGCLDLSVNMTGFVLINT